VNALPGIDPVYLSRYAPDSVLAKDWTPAVPYDAQYVGTAPLGVAEQRHAKDRRERPGDEVTGSRVLSHAEPTGA
jgi:hypothetical protein